MSFTTFKADKLERDEWAHIPYLIELQKRHELQIKQNPMVYNIVLFTTRIRTI